MAEEPDCTACKSIAVRDEYGDLETVLVDCILPRGHAGAHTGSYLSPRFDVRYIRWNRSDD